MLNLPPENKPWNVSGHCTERPAKKIEQHKMKETWNYKPMNLLKDARLGNKTELNDFLKLFSNLTFVNEDFSVLLIFRQFKVQYGNERRVLNCHPEDENHQYGITIARCDEEISSESNVYLPNNLEYKDFKINGQEIEIITNTKTVKTNITELFRKLKFFKLSITEEEIEKGFNSLNNEQFEKPKKLEVKNKTIQIPSLGKLSYNDKLEWYEGKLKTENKTIEVSVYNAEPNELEKLISFVDKQINAKFYEEMLLKMESKMINLKNDAWLGEDEETGEDEPAMTIENFRKRISISSIMFYDDCTSSIYCNDDDIFWGHSIDISVDKNGKYKDVNLAG